MGLNGAIDLDKPAPTLLAYLARRRAGYSGLNTGCETPHTNTYEGILWQILTENRLGHPQEQPYVPTDCLP